MKMVNLTAETEEAYSAIDAICADARIDLRDCYQCGKCAAGCPVASAADMNCRQVVRSLQLGLIDDVCAARMPWLCVGCATCVTRCPHDVDIPSLHEAICRYAVARGRVAVKEAQKFDDIFLNTIQNKGVNDEVMFAAKFNLFTGHLFQDVANSPRMLMRGLLAGDGYAPSDAADVRRMMQAIRSTAGSAQCSAQCGAQGGEQCGAQGGEQGEHAGAGTASDLEPVSHASSGKGGSQ